MMIETAIANLGAASAGGANVVGQQIITEPATVSPGSFTDETVETVISTWHKSVQPWAF